MNDAITNLVKIEINVCFLSIPIYYQSTRRCFMKKCSRDRLGGSFVRRLAQLIRKRLLPLMAALSIALTAFPMPASARGRIIRVGVNAGFGISTIGGSNTGFALDYLR